MNPDPRAPRVLIVDDHQLFRAGVRSELEGHLEIAGDAATVPDDRRGVRESIVGRMTRHGGRAAVHRAPGGGTEVELVLER